jgi:hypothetical protein
MDYMGRFNVELPMLAEAVAMHHHPKKVIPAAILAPLPFLVVPMSTTSTTVAHEVYTPAQTPRQRTTSSKR